MTGIQILFLKAQLKANKEEHNAKMRKLQEELEKYEQVIRDKIRSLEDDLDVENMNKAHSNNITIHFNNFDNTSDIHEICNKLINELKIKSFKVN